MDNRTIEQIRDNETKLIRELQQKENIIKEVREYITSIETDYSIGCWNKEQDEFIDVKKDILGILDKVGSDKE